MTSFLFSILVLFFVNFTTGELEGETSSNVVTGRLFPADDQFAVPWLMETQVHLRGAEQKGFLRDDGSFMFANIAPGSYIVEVTNPNYFYEPIRVEINSKGKIRARKVNHIQTSQVVQVPYPLKMKPITQMRYFQLREQWRIADFLFNPMVLMMVLPLLLVMLLPRVMNDPEAKKEMEQFNNLTKYDMPEMSEMITTFFAGEQQSKGKVVKKTKNSKESKK